MMRMSQTTRIIAYQEDRIKKLREKIKTLKKRETYYKHIVHSLIGRLSRFETKLKKLATPIKKKTRESSPLPLSVREDGGEHTH
jgi:SMC interacting uncharacterized protein involved in chromosome segregation